MSGGDSPAPTASQAVDRSFVHSLAWTGLGKWTVQLMSWGATLVTARLLAPHDYGLFGLATLYLGLLAMLSEFGLTSTAVNLRELGPSQLAELNGLALLIGMAASLSTIASALPMAGFF